MTTELTQKLENIISGHSINEDDADWLRALTQRPAAQEVDWRTPTTYAQRFTDAVALLCRETPPSDMVAGWIDINADDQRLQDWACERAPAWAQGIGLLDAAHVMASQPTEGVDHEPAPQQATPEPVGERATVPLDALHAAERERDYWKTRARAMLDHAEGTCWYWMGDGEDHLESLVSSLPVVIRADQLRELLAHPAPGVPAKLPSAYATSTEDGTWRVLLAFDNKDDAEATRRFLHDHGVQPRTMRSSAPGVPEGWRMDREGDDAIVVQHPAVGLARAINPAMSMEGQVLFMLCDDILQDSQSLAAAQAKGGV